MKDEKKSRKFGFLCLGRPAKNVSSPCAFEALTCVLVMQCFNFSSQGWKLAITTC